MKISLKDIPSAVIEVWIVADYCKRYNTGVGAATIRRCRETIEKYPEYFKTENNGKHKEEPPEGTTGQETVH